MGTFAVNNFGDTRSGGLAGPMGLVVVVLMSIAVVLLIRNMNKRLRRLPDSFPVQTPAQRAAEIAKLNADLARPTAEPVPQNVDKSHPEVTLSTTQDEVTATNTDRDDPSTDGDAGRL